MNCYNLLRISFLITLTLSACASSPQPKVGKWEGEPAISFEITEDGKVIDFQIDGYQGSGSFDKCSIRFDVVEIMEDSSIFWHNEITIHGLTNDNVVHGKFENEISIKGTYGFEWCLRGEDISLTSFSSGGQDHTWWANWVNPKQKNFF